MVRLVEGMRCCEPQNLIGGLSEDGSGGAEMKERDAPKEEAILRQLE